MRRFEVLVVGLFALLASWATPAHAQRLSVEGDVDRPAARELRAIIARDNYQIVDRDTILPASYHRTGDLLVIGSTVRLEGEVDGEIAVVSGTLFVRPGGRVTGRTVSINGYVLPSGNAEIGDVLLLPLEFSSSLSRLGPDYVLSLVAPPAPSPFATQGIYGLLFPTYDRVDGASLRWGAGLRLGSGTMTPRASGSVVYRTARGTIGGSGNLTVPLGGRVTAVAAGGRETLTNEEWIRGDLSNSVAALVARSDARNYYSSDFALLRVAIEHPAPLIAGEGFIAPRLEFRASRDRALETRSVWTFFDRDTPWRDNPPVAGGTITSGIAGATVGWRGNSTRFSGDISAEWGHISADTVLYWRYFGFLKADARWEMQALWGHSISVRAHVLRPLGPAGAPPQRWSFLGGPGTLPTLEYGARRGDHLVFIQSTYSIPLTSLGVPFLGPPILSVHQAIGNAWPTGIPSPRWEQNVGAGLKFSVFSLFVDIDPSSTDLNPAFSAGIELP